LARIQPESRKAWRERPHQSTEKTSMKRFAAPATRLMAALLALLSACGSPPPSTPAAAPAAPAAPVAASAAAASTAPVEALAPNPNLSVQGIPPIPLSLVRQAEKYTDFRGHSFVDWHPTKREMLVSHRPAGGSTVQLFRIAGPRAAPEPLTHFDEPVRTASYEPRRGDYLVFERSSGGNEADQVYRMDLPSKKVTLLTDPNQRHEMQGWLNRGSQMLVMSVPLDKTAAGGTRATISQTLKLIDPRRPKDARTVAVLPGGGWFAGGVSRDDTQVALTRYLSAGESQVWLLNIATGKNRQLLPAPGSSLRATHFAGEFKPDGSGLYVYSDRDGEFRELMMYSFSTGLMTPLARQIPWDMSGGSLTQDGALYAAQANVDGRDELRLFDARSFRELTLPRLPAGSVTESRFHRKLPELAFAVNGAQGPNQIFSIDPAKGSLEQWTEALAPPGVDTRAFADPQIVRWNSFDGRSISGLLNLPPARFAGKRPVLIQIHGGPEAQAKMGFMGRYNYFLDELGIAVIEPNVRGSSGYGKTFLTLDNGRLREDSVKDIGALLDWIATQPRLDASRVVVSGGSYGGYMSLAVATNYPDRIAGAIDVVGISSFVTFLQNTESYRRDLRRVEYGDERDPAMRSFLDSISPLNNAGKISKPLFVVQGKNDPRVPYTEAEQIVAKLREQRTPVWYLRAENEGHGFARKENADFQFYATVMFLQATLLKP
jgi:prolyl oligopeptidase PreP (S9A serine peptidase family)